MACQHTQSTHIKHTPLPLPPQHSGHDVCVYDRAQWQRHGVSLAHWHRRYRALPSLGTHMWGHSDNAITPRTAAAAIRPLALTLFYTRRNAKWQRKFLRALHRTNYIPRSTRQLCSWWASVRIVLRLLVRYCAVSEYRYHFHLLMLLLFLWYTCWSNQICKWWFCLCRRHVRMYKLLSIPPQWYRRPPRNMFIVDWFWGVLQSLGEWKSAVIFCSDLIRLLCID